MPPGTEVTFYDRTFKGDEYKDLSEDKVNRKKCGGWGENVYPT